MRQYFHFIALVSVNVESIGSMHIVFMFYFQKSLPELRKAIKRNELTIDGLNPPAVVPTVTSSSTVSIAQNNIIQPMIRVSRLVY